MAIQMAYPVARFSTLARVGGAGFKVLAKLDHKRPILYERVFARIHPPLQLSQNPELLFLL